MINLAIVEDDLLYIKQLRAHLERYQNESGNVIMITEYYDGEDIIDGYQGNHDIILMDIQMCYLDGMTAAEKIRQIDQEVIIMFITNMTQYAIRGYEVNALDYVVKPVEYFAFSQKLDKAIGKLRKGNNYYISIPIENGVKKLDIGNVYYIESQGHTLIYQSKDGEFPSRGTMKGIEEIMTPYGFFRSNNGYLVNMKYVDGIQDNCCMICKRKLPVSRSRRKLFMDTLNKYMSEVMR